MKSGICIAFEGIDLSGKTTQLKLLAERLISIGYDVFVTKEPGSPHSKINKKKRKILLDKENTGLNPLAELGLFMTDRALHVPIIQEQLKRGKIVLTDRQFASTIAYQVFGRGLGNFEFVLKMNTFFASGFYPNLILLFDLDPKIALTRARTEAERSRFDVEGLKFHNRVRQGYFELRNKLKKIKALSTPLWDQDYDLDENDGDEDDGWVKFDATKTVGELADEVFETVVERIKKLKARGG